MTVKGKKQVQEYERTKPLTPFYDGQVATLLPVAARQALATVSQIERHKKPAESVERSIALDATIKRIKLQYPEFFRSTHRSV